MTRRLKRGLAAIFVLHIVLPLAAPLQMLDLGDLFGVQVHRSTVPISQSTTPAISEATSEAGGISLLAPVTSCRPVATLAPALLSTGASFALSTRLSVASHVQRSVLRL